MTDFRGNPFFDGHPGQPVDVLTQLMRERGTNVGLFPPRLINAARHELADATTGFMSMNLADVAAAGWKKYDALKKAARRTGDDPDAKELVSLTTHKIASSHHPSVDLYLDRKLIATVDIDLEVALTIAGMIAVVRRGRLTGIQSGTCTASGSLAVQRHRHDHTTTPVRPLRSRPAGSWHSAAGADSC